MIKLKTEQFRSDPEHFNEIILKLNKTKKFLIRTFDNTFSSFKYIYEKTRHGNLLHTKFKTY